MRRHLEHLEAASILTEEGYVDGEFADDYAAFYGRCDRPYLKTCRRVHFFRTLQGFEPMHDRESFNALIQGSGDSMVAALKQAYLGYIVARPLDQTVVGRTVLIPWEDEPGRRNYTAVASYHAHICGLEIPIPASLPFQEQESACSTCSTIALWSAFQQTSHVFGSPAPRPMKITNDATTSHLSGRQLPAGGLEPQQMCAAVTAIGLDPELFRIIRYEEVKGKESAYTRLPWISLIYSYLKGKVPVVLICKSPGDLDLHAITVCGYATEEDGRQLRASESRDYSAIPLYGARILEFYAHDDQRGPYCHYFVAETATKSGSTPLLMEWVDEPDEGEQERNLEVLAALVPVPKQVRVSFESVYELVVRLTSALKWGLRIEDAEFQRLEWDLWLSSSNDFKHDIRTKINQMPAYQEILRTQLPRHIWRAQLKFDGHVFSELLFDATEAPRAVCLRWWIWHHEQLKDVFLDSMRDAAQHRQAAMTSILGNSLADWMRNEFNLAESFDIDE